MVYLNQFRFPDEEVIERWQTQNAPSLKGYNVEEFMNVADANNQSLSKYTQSRFGELERGFSNGESALIDYQIS